MALFHGRGGMLARFGYSLTASPLRYGVRSEHDAFKTAGRSWTLFSSGTSSRSGRSLPAISAANLGFRSANATMFKFIVAPISLFTACHAGFWSMPGGGGVMSQVNTFTVASWVGCSFTDLNSVFG